MFSVLFNFIFRQYFKAAYYYLDEPHRIAPPAKEPVKWEDFPGPDGGNDSGAISVPNFADHVMKMHADSDAGFAKEYSEIQKLSYNKYTSEQSSHPDNKCKNRYLNIVACKYIARISINSNSTIYELWFDKLRSSVLCNLLKIITLQSPLPHLYKFLGQYVH